MLHKSEDVDKRCSEMLNQLSNEDKAQGFFHKFKCCYGLLFVILSVVPSRGHQSKSNLKFSSVLVVCTDIVNPR